jgi:hypothetical protein
MLDMKEALPVLTAKDGLKGDPPDDWVSRTLTTNDATEVVNATTLIE